MPGDPKVPAVLEGVEGAVVTVGLLVVVAGRPIARHIVRALRRCADKWDKLLGPPPDEKPPDGTA